MNSASTTVLRCAPAAAKAASNLGGSCSERAGATMGRPDSSSGVSSLRDASAWRGGRMATQRIWNLATVTAVSSIGSSAMPMSKLSLGSSWLTTSEWREISRTDTPGRVLTKSATSLGSSEMAAQGWLAMASRPASPSRIWAAAVSRRSTSPSTRVASA